jgi:hypothetical protein
VTLIAGCVSWSFAAPCEFSKTQSKIPVLVIDADAAAAERLAKQLLGKLQHATPRPPIEVKAVAGVAFTITPSPENIRNTVTPTAMGTEAVRDLGIKERVALVLWREKSKWLAVVVRAQNESVLGFPVPKATWVPTKRIGSFLQSFAYYYNGDSECALDGFKRLARDSGKRLEPDAMTFWTASTLARLGRNDEAASRLRLMASSVKNGEDGQGSYKLALALLLMFRAQRHQDDSREVISLLEDAARVFKGNDERNWIASQIALGRYWLLTSGRTSPEGLLVAQRYFDQAEPLLVFPGDAAEWANLHSLMGMTQLQLGLAVKDSGEHFASAADHFQAARVIWIKIGNEVEVEALSQQLRYTFDLRSRMR